MRDCVVRGLVGVRRSLSHCQDYLAMSIQKKDLSPAPALEKQIKQAGVLVKGYNVTP